MHRYHVIDPMEQFNHPHLINPICYYPFLTYPQYHVIDPMERFNHAVMTVAERVRGTCVFIRIPATEHTLIQFFGIPLDRLPQVD